MSDALHGHLTCLQALLELEVICVGIIVASKRASSSYDDSFDSLSESLSAEVSSDSFCSLSDSYLSVILCKYYAAV